MPLTSASMTGHPHWPADDRLAFTAKSCGPHHGIHHRRHKLHFFLGMTVSGFSQLTSQPDN